MRFLVDENVPRQIGHFLKEQGSDVLIVRDSPHAGAPDEALWQLAVDEHRIIVTQDRDFPLQGMHGLPAAVILIRPRDNRPASILSQFKRFWDSVSAEEIEGFVFSVGPNRFRRRPLLMAVP